MINRIIELLNKIGDIQIIPAYSEHKPPEKPYSTYSIISLNSADFFGEHESKYIEKENIYIETAEYRMLGRIQFDIYCNSQDETIEKATNLREIILFKLRYEWSRIGVGIVKHSEIKNLNEIINSKYEYRSSFDIVFEYIKSTKEREVSIVNEIELIANKKGESKWVIHIESQ